MMKTNIRNLLAVSLLFIIIVSCGKKNVIEGNIGYPSDYVPQVEVFLENVITGSQMKQLVEASYDGESAYCFSDVPDGKYIVFAIPTEADIESLVGGYTKAVPCGLTVDCDNHDYIELDVKEGKHLRGINIYDWYTDAIVIKQKQYYI
ncbi:MAG: hypothetical protein ACK5KT_03600 [Dysgonomonas sp.]